MHNLDEQLESDLKKIGVYIEPPTPLIADPRPNLLGVKVEIGLGKGIDVDLPKFNIITVNRRGVRTTFSDFQVINTEQGNKLMFFGYQQMPDGTNPPLTEKLVATSFIDLCYFQGNEAVDPKYIPGVNTEIAPNASKEDLGWYLPSRFVDSMIDAMGKLNDVFLSGLLDEAILYGVVSKGR